MGFLSSTVDQIRSKSSSILGLCWLLMQLICFKHFGIVTGFESGKYIEQGDHLLQSGHYTSSNFILYSTEILLIAVSKKLQTGYWLVVAVQLFFNLASTYVFYRVVEKFTAQKMVAFVFTLAFIVMFYYQLYNVHLFTESLYFSFSILFFYRLITLSKARWQHWVQTFLLLVLLYFTRPVGLFFIPASFVFFVLKFFRKRAGLIFLVGGLVTIFFILLLNQSMSAGGEFDFLLPYTQGEIICGVPLGNNYVIAMPVEKNSVQGLLYLITHYPALFFSLFFKRLLAFFGVVRSFYSVPHNIFIGVFFYSLYILTFVGIRKRFVFNKPEICFLLTMIFLTAVTTGLSCDEWHGRFIYAVLPFFMMLASFAFTRFQNKKSQIVSP